MYSGYAKYGLKKPESGPHEKKSNKYEKLNMSALSYKNISKQSNQAEPASWITNYTNEIMWWCTQ